MLYEDQPSLLPRKNIKAESEAAIIQSGSPRNGGEIAMIYIFIVDNVRYVYIHV